MELTPHPFQRSGAWAAALICGRETPAQITDGDLEFLVEKIADDCERSGRLSKGDVGWAWLVRLAGMYPQSPPVHPSRHKSTNPIGQRVAGFLGADAGSGSGAPSWPCWTCGTPGVTVKWGKDRWPLTDPVHHLNNTSMYGGGLPCCRRCRIAVWTLPYATAAAGHLHQTVTSLSSPAEKAVTAAHLKINEQALAQGWTSWREAPRADDVLWERIAARGGIADYEVLRWQAGNRDAHLTAIRLTEASSRLLAQTHQAGAANDLRRAAWRTMRTHPVDLAADPRLLHQALTIARQEDRAALEQLTEPAAAPADLTPLSR